MEGKRSHQFKIDFIGNKVCRFVYPQITLIFADFILKIFRSVQAPDTVRQGMCARSVDYFR